jgi:C4-dicarboxylate transporter DctM subunit
MTIVAIVLLLTFIVLIILGVPVAFSIILADFLALIVRGDIPLIVVPQRLFAGVNSFPLLAVPFFIIAGDIMLKGGITTRLIKFATSLLGWSKYCLAYINVAASAFFAAISGSGPATNAAIGGMMYEEMINNGYDKDFSAFLGAIAGSLGPLIPPSIAIVLWAMQTGISVGTTFIYSGVAGVILAFVYAFAARFSQRNNQKLKSIGHPTLKGIWIAFKDVIWGLISPLIIIVGIYSGYFTPTEAAVISVVYSWIVGMFIYKELTWKKLFECIIDSVLTSSMVLILVSVASLFSWILTIEGVGAYIRDLALAANNPNQFILVVLIIYLVLGCFIDAAPNIILTAPMLHPIAVELGIDPYHFAIMSVFALNIGLVTPPFGLNLFVSAGYSGCSLGGMVRKGKWLLIAGIIMIFVYAYFPQIYIWAR